MKENGKEKITEGGTVAREGDYKYEFRKGYKVDDIGYDSYEMKRSRNEKRESYYNSNNEDYFKRKQINGQAKLRTKRRRDYSRSEERSVSRRNRNGRSLSRRNRNERSISRRNRNERSISRGNRNERREDFRIPRKDVSKRIETNMYKRNLGPGATIGESQKMRRARVDPYSQYNNEKYGKPDYYGYDRRTSRDIVNGGEVPFEEGRRSPYLENLLARNKRTVFVGNIPCSVVEPDELLNILNIHEPIVEEIRIRSPPMYRRNEPGIYNPEKIITKKAYITLKREKDVKELLEKNGIMCKGNSLKIDMVINSKNYDKEKTILVKSLNFRMTEWEFSQLFSHIGKVKGFRLIRDKNTNRSLGYGFVYFEDKESVDKAIRLMNGKVVLNRRIIVTQMQDNVQRRHNFRNPVNSFIADRRNFPQRVKKHIDKRAHFNRRK